MKSKQWRRGRCTLLKPGIAAAAMMLALAAQAGGIQVSGGASITMGGETSAIRIDCGDLGVQGSFNAGAGTVALTGTLAVAANAFTAGTGTVSMGPAREGCASGNTGRIEGSPTFYNWSAVGATSGKPNYTVQMPQAQTTTVGGALTLQGINLVKDAGGMSILSMQAKATPEPIRPADNTQAWLKYTGTGTPSISNIGVNGVQSLDVWLAPDQTNQTPDGTAYNWFTRALVPDPDSGGGPGGGLAKATPVPALGLEGLLALSTLLGAAAVLRRRRTGN